MRRSQLFNRVLTATALLLCLLASYGTARAQDWSGVVDMIISEVPFNGIGSGIDTPDFDFGPGDFDRPSLYRGGGGYYSGGNNYYRSGNGGGHATPRVATPRNEIPEQIVEPFPNERFTIASEVLTSTTIAEFRQQLVTASGEAINRFASLLPNNVALAAEIQASSFDRTTHSQAFSLVTAGETDSLHALFLDPATGGTPQEQDSLMRQTEARRQLAHVLQAASAGSLSDADLLGLRIVLVDFLPTADGSPSPLALAKADELANILHTNSRVIALLDAAVPGTATLPTGNDAQLIVSPDFPPGSGLPLGPGSAIIGALDPAATTFVAIGNALQASGAPIGAGDPLTESTREEITSGVFLTNSAELPVSYVLNGTQEFAMQSTYRQILPGTTDWTIVFDRGDARGEARYDLDGSYRFELTGDGWELYRTTFDITLDNSANAHEFHYVLNNKAHVVPAGESVDHNDLIYPPVVRFDNGDGTVRKKSLADGSYSVLLSGDGQSIEIFAADSGHQLDAAAVQIALEPTPLEIFTLPEAAEPEHDFFGAAHSSTPRGLKIVETAASTYDD